MRSCCLRAGSLLSATATSLSLQVTGEKKQDNVAGIVFILLFQSVQSRPCLAVSTACLAPSATMDSACIYRGPACIHTYSIGNESTVEHVASYNHIICISSDRANNLPSYLYPVCWERSLLGSSLTLALADKAWPSTCGTRNTRPTLRRQTFPYQNE